MMAFVVRRVSVGTVVVGANVVEMMVWPCWCGDDGVAMMVWR